jgi:hypothetical protein
LPAIPYVARPGGGDPVDDGFDLAIIQHTLERRHGGAVVLKVGRFGHAILRDRHQKIAIMVPDVAAFIVRQCGRQAVRVSDLPVGLAFQITSLAGRAIN